MMRIIALSLLFSVAACATHVSPREGKQVPVDAPQSAEQCKVQPWLDWCK